MKLKITYERTLNLCFATTMLPDGATGEQQVSAAGHTWEEAKANLIEKVRIETGFADTIPPDEEIEITGKIAEETGSLFSPEADKQFEHTPEDYRIAIPPPEQTDELAKQ
jgi:hypothetical protein